MAEITFNTAHQEERVREQIKTAVAAYREMLDTFVGDRMRRVAAGAEQAPPRQPPAGSSPSIKTR
jgi:predicted Zn-dependent peptidase